MGNAPAQSFAFGVITASCASAEPGPVLSRMLAGTESSKTLEAETVLKDEDAGTFVLPPSMMQPSSPPTSETARSAAEVEEAEEAEAVTEGAFPIFMTNAAVAASGRTCPRFAAIAAATSAFAVAAAARSRPNAQLPAAAAAAAVAVLAAAVAAAAVSHRRTRDGKQLFQLKPSDW